MSTPSAQRRDRERARLRDSILAAAQEILEKEGHESISIRAVADSIEYAPATLYLHFTDKEAILAELGRQGFKRVAARMRPVQEDDPVEQIVSLGRVYLEFANEHPRLYELMFLAKGLNFFDPASPEMSQGPECFQLLHESVKRGQSAGALRKDLSAPILTYSILGTMHGIASFAVSQRFLWIEPDQLPILFETAARATVLGLAP